MSLFLARLAQNHRAGAGPSDPYFSSVALLMHMEGVNGGTSFTDSSSSHKTCTVIGGTTTSTAAEKFGSSSCLITGTDAGGISLASSADFGFGAGDFTIEGWVNVGNVSTRLNTILDLRVSGTGIQFFVGGGIYTVPANSIGCSSNTGILATATGMSANVWTHVAITRASGTVRGFINGVLVFTVSDTRTYGSSLSAYIGRDTGGTSYQGFGGYLDDLRVTKGVARYTANFTPPTAAFPDH